MMPGDPEQEIVARNIAAILMARQIRQAGRIHPQTILTEIGALAGFAAQMSIRKSVIEAQKLDPDNVLIEVVTKSGEKYYFGELLNFIVFENLSAAPYSIRAYVREAVPQESRAVLTDVAEIASNAARTIGSRRFGVPRLASGHMPRKMPRAALTEHWRLAVAELTAAKRNPSLWPYDLAFAAQWQMITSRDLIVPPLAATIVMEAAIPMSRLDPATVAGALA